jgi:hypothetical protein
MTDRLFRMLTELPESAPDPVRAARVRSRCHAALARSRRTRRHPQRLRATDALLASLAAAYLIETVRQTLQVIGIA